jgi:[NiFe] hydrogenase assembly HybE family chaperone
MSAAVAAGRPADELRLEGAYERIWRERMADLPFLNGQLRVEALGFRDWQGVRVGALVTPWSINLVLLPAPGATLPLPRPGAPQSWTFPSGAYSFEGREEATLGGFQQCSLFSPALEFASHDAAVAVARAALEALFAAPSPAQLSRRGLLLGG